MECKKETCRNKFTKPYSCSRCDSKFCSNSCMIDHFFLKHEKDPSDSTNLKNSSNNLFHNLAISDLKINKRNSGSGSIFLKKGYFLSEIKLENYFNFENFEKVKLGNKIHLLGTGAFGEVYLVRHKKDGKDFAVKQMNKNRILNTGATLEIIRREIDIHCRLVHENIIRLFSYSEDSSSFYLLMEYANSGSLFRKIRKNKQLDEKSAFKYFIQTAAAIFFVHENNLIHRDIKPENLLLDDRGNIKLCDFGWCVELEIGNRNTVCGTPEYMAPEIIREMPYDKSIDIWSLGVLLYELLHGYSPFRANENGEQDNTQVMRNVIKHNLTIDRKDLSKSCKLLIKDKNCRLKIKDVFGHPWVLEFEKELSCMGKDLQDSFTQDKLNEISPKMNCVSYYNTAVPLEGQDTYKLNNYEEGNNKNLNLWSGKLNSANKATSPTTADGLLALPTECSDTLFDKVLIQVKEKNRDKRKKSKLVNFGDNDLSQISCVDQNYYIIKKEAGRKKSCDIIFKNADNINQIERIPKDCQTDMKNKHSFIVNESGSCYKSLEISKITESSSINIDANEKIKSQQDIDVESFSIFNETKFKPTINPKNSKLIADSTYCTTNIRPNDSNKNSNEENIINKKRIEEQAIMMNYNIPMRMKSNSSYNDILLVGNKIRESDKSPKQYLTGSKQPNIKRELDMSFLPKELLYEEKTYEQSNQNLLSAIEILENAQKEIIEEKVKPKSFWDSINPFKCG